MASQRRKQNSDTDDTPQGAKRHKTSPQNLVPRRPNVSRRKCAVQAAAPTKPSTAKSAPPHEKTTKSKRSFRPKQKLRPPRRPVAPPLKPEPRGLLSLSLELKQQIFLHASARDTARLRRVCKALDADVRSSAKYLAKVLSRKEIERVQQQVDEFTSLKPPTDLDSLLKALNVWTKRRGISEDHEAQWQSSAKLMVHLLNRKETGSTFSDHFNMNIVPWTEVAVSVEQLHRRFENGNTEQMDLEYFFDAVTSPGLLDYNECDKLFESVQHPESRLSGRLWPSGTRERTTFPQGGTMSPLLQYPLWSEHDPNSAEYDEHTEALVDYLSGRPTMPLLEATHGSMHLIRHLDLPVLPNEVFCYYLEAEWARKEANKLFDRVAIKANPVRVSPLLIAAILETVMLF